ncbi:MAG TPA: dTDP-glucose 4,6-dehydratase [Alphaproteobacteria bacterium]|nr:dTDP-glucose 4,6-dehydratase [Alphaproteobacteria bacterium]HAJ47827.1 dTDP-glucose 4,6-dehydratase [Alphaproteobacteria bacterium]
MSADAPHNLSRAGEPFSAVMSRRDMLRAAGLLSAAAILPGLPAAASASAAMPLDFDDLPLKVIYDHAVASGYDANVLIRWGDPVEAGAPPFVGQGRPAAAQAKQFGTANDFIGYFPIGTGNDASSHGLLSVNHEFNTMEVFFPGVTDRNSLTKEQLEADQMAHGLSIIEVKRTNGQWRVVSNSRYGRRITPQTPCVLSGPVAGHPRAKTIADPTGRNVLGTVANCAGGKTPWGTVLTAEENFQNFFRGMPPEEHPEFKSLEAAGITGKGKNPWGIYEFRWDAGLDPQEPVRFGYMVEIDPYDPKAKPIKRTHLGRFRHEAASVVINKDGRVVVYLGEDRISGFIYRFVSAKPYAASMSKAEAGALLDEGTLFVAKFTAEALEWIPLLPGQGALKDFATLGDVMIDCYLAAIAVGGTPMDRPEDIDFNPVTGRVYANLTMNRERKPDAVDAANPRGPNEDGHVLEFAPSGGDHTEQTYRWSVVMLCGPQGQSRYGEGTKTALSCPDNLAVDPKGRLWIATDNWRYREETNPIPNGLFACTVEGPERAKVKFFYNIPKGAELCGPEFTPDGRTLFVAVQDPGFDPTGNGLNWPDRRQGMPPRSSVVVITRKDNGPIGG